MTLLFWITFRAIFSFYSGEFQQLRKVKEFSWFNGLRTQHSVHEDGGLITGLAQWVKDLALLQAVVQAGNCSSNSTPTLGTSMFYRCGPKKKKKKVAKAAVFDLIIKGHTVKCTIKFSGCPYQMVHRVKICKTFSPLKITMITLQN